MHIAVGSTNPVKIAAVQEAVGEKLSDVQFEGFEVASGIAEQPLSDTDTRKGAHNRAFAAMEAAKVAHPGEEVALAVGLEGGVFPFEGGLWSTVWIVAVDAHGKTYESNGARFPLPKLVSDLLMNGEELGPLMHRLTGDADVRKKQGAFGVLTKGFIDRTEAYTAIAKVAIGQWYGKDWDLGLQSE